MTHRDQPSIQSINHSTPHTLIVSIVDSRGGMDIFNIKITSITFDQFMMLLRLLYTFRLNLKTTTHNYISLITDTISTINVLMAENEGNPVYAIESTNFQYCDSNEMEEMIESINKHTLDINISYWLPTTLHCPSLHSFIENVNQQQLFSVDLYARQLPNWNTMLTELQLLVE